MDGPRTRLRLRVSPGADRSEIVGRQGEAWKVRVAAAAERGKANDALLTLLAEALRVPRARLELVRGWRTRDKVVVLRDLTEPEAAIRLAAAASGDSR